MPDTQAVPTLGIGITSPSPELPQICGNAGCGVVLIDMEHGPISIEPAYRMVTALRHTPAEAWIRVTGNDPNLIKLALGAGAENVVVPMVTTRAEAQAAVSAAKYPPFGTRGFGPFRTQYQRDKGMFEYAATANEDTKITFLIEHPTAIENLDEILSVKGLDGALAVPLDLAVNMGHMDNPAHEEVVAALQIAEKKIAEKGFRNGRSAITPEQGQAALRDGIDFLFLGFDVMFVPAAVQLYLKALKA